MENLLDDDSSVESTSTLSSSLSMLSSEDELYFMNDTDEQDDFLDDYSDQPTTNNKTYPQWRDVSPSDVEYYHNEGRKISLSCAKEEVLFIKEKLESMKENSSNTSSSMTDFIIGLYFGKDSPVVAALREILECNYDTVLKFIGMYSIQTMFSKDLLNLGIALQTANVDASFLYFLPEGQYKYYWMKLSNHGMCNSDSESSRRISPSWEKLQNAFNTIQRRIVIEENDNNLGLVFDDDKIWLDVSGKNANDLFDLKLTRHTRDNRNGITFHTMATSGINIPVNGQMERAKDSATKAFNRSVTYVLSGTENQDSSSDLPYSDKIGMYLDRGYTSLEKISMMIKSGAEFLGTQKRHPSCPFTFEQVLGDKDKREIITTNGCKSQFVKTKKIEHRSVAVHAYKNGSGKVSIVTSSEFLNHSWDGIPLEKFNIVDKVELSKDEYITPLKIEENAPNVTEEFTTAIVNQLEQKIDFITATQSTADWFLLRSFSFSSKQSASCIRVAFPYFYQLSQQKKDWEDVAKLIYGGEYSRSLLPVHERSDAPAHLNLHDAITGIKTYVKNKSNENGGLNDDFRDWISNVNSMLEHDTLMSEGAVDNISDRCLREAVNFLFQQIENEKDRDSIPRSVTSQRTFMKEFYSSHNCYRSLMCYGKNVLISTCSFMRLKYKKDSSRVKLRKLLSETTTNNNVQNTHHNNNDQRYKKTKRRVIQSILDGTFQTKLTGEKKEACNIGHKNESKLISNFVSLFSNSQNNRSSSIDSAIKIEKIVAVYSVGLVAKKGNIAIKDSIDGIVVLQVRKENNRVVEEIWGIEVKTRVSHAEANREREFQKNTRKVSHMCTIDKFVRFEQMCKTKR